MAGERGRWIRESLARPFLSSFRYWWRVLPRAEAQATLKEIKRTVLQEEDVAVDGSVQDIPFSLVQAHPELPRAVERYPKGLQSIHEEVEAEQRNLPPPDPNQSGFVKAWGERGFNHSWAYLKSMQTGDFTELLQKAAAAYPEDTALQNPNFAPKCFGLPEICTARLSTRWAKYRRNGQNKSWAAYPIRTCG